MVLVTFKDKIVFTDQIGQFWNVLDLVGINPNLRGGLWNLPIYIYIYVRENHAGRACSCLIWQEYVVKIMLVELAAARYGPTLFSFLFCAKKNQSFFLSKE